MLRTECCDMQIYANLAFVYIISRINYQRLHHSVECVVLIRPSHIECLRKLSWKTIRLFSVISLRWRQSHWNSLHTRNNEQVHNTSINELYFSLSSSVVHNKLFLEHSSNTRMKGSVWRKMFCLAVSRKYSEYLNFENSTYAIYKNWLGA